MMESKTAEASASAVSICGINVVVLEVGLNSLVVQLVGPPTSESVNFGVGKPCFQYEVLVNRPDDFGAAV